MPAMIRRHSALGPREEPPTESLAELYHENTKLRRLPGMAPAARPSFTPAELRAMARAYKQYRMHPHVPLPSPAAPIGPGITFDDVVAARRSGRGFADADLELAVLAKLLHQSYGVTGEVRLPGGIGRSLRAAPSAGALYPAESYLGVRRVDGLRPGIYHYNVPEHALALLAAGDPTERIYEAWCWQEGARQAAVVLIIAGVMGRTKRKYGERGYRYVLLEAGHIAQNLLLAAAALGLAAVTTGGFFDDAANELLRLDGVEETVLYSAFVGKPGAGETDPMAGIVEDGVGTEGP